MSKIRSARVDVHRYKPYLKARCVKIYGLFLLAVPKFFAPKISQSFKTRNFAYIYLCLAPRFKLFLARQGFSNIVLSAAGRFWKIFFLLRSKLWALLWQKMTESWRQCNQNNNNRSFINVASDALRWYASSSSC